MTEHTTIQITKAQADELQERRTHEDESYKSVIARLLECDSSAIDAQEIAASIRRELGFDGNPENVADVDALAEAVADRIDTHSTVSLEASEYSNIADEIQGRLR